MFGSERVALLACVNLTNIDLDFHVRTRKQWAIKEYILSGAFLRPPEPLYDVHALKDVSLRISSNERNAIDWSEKQPICWVGWM